jgi:cytidyltransferase-like protein
MKTRLLRTALCHGVFDLLHCGHLWTLGWAKAHADRLVVTLTPDEDIVARKGRRPVYPLEHRLELVGALKCVDVCVAGRGATALWSLKTFDPDVWVRGADWKRRCTAVSHAEEALAKQLGTDILFAPAWEPDYRSSDAMEYVLAWNRQLET